MILGKWICKIMRKHKWRKPHKNENLVRSKVCRRCGWAADVKHQQGEGGGMSPLGREISRLLLRETEWRCTKYKLMHMPTGLTLWIANGAWFFDVDTDKHAIGLIERHWLWRRARRLIKLLKPREPTLAEQQQKILERIKVSNKQASQ